MDVWLKVMDFTERNADKVEQSQWNLNYLEVVGINYEPSPKLDDICKGIPKLRIETHTRYVKPQVESKLGLNFKYRPPRKRSWRPLERRTVSVQVVVPKVEVISRRNCFCTCNEDFSNGNDVRHYHVSLDKLLEIIQHHGQDKIRGAAILNIATAFGSDISINEDTAIRILMMLDSSSNVVQECVLLVIHRLSKVLVNSKLFLLHGVLDDLIYLMLMGSNEQVQTQAACCIAKLTERKELVRFWSETMVISGTEALIDVLEAEEVASDDLRNYVIKTIANMANNEKLAAMLLEFGLERVVKLIRLQSDKEDSVVPPKTQGLIVKILTNIVYHNCSKVEQFLEKYSEAVEGILDILQYGECQEQQEAARFLATLTIFKPSIDSIISHHATQHLLWAMTCSHCRSVREYSSEAFKNIAFHQDKDKLLNALSQLSSSASSESFTETLSEWVKQDESSKLVNTVKSQISCTALEKIMVDVFPVICVSFQTDSLHLSEQQRLFNGSDNCTSNNYLSSLRVLRNTMAVIEKVICINGADSEETGVNLKLASLYVQCGGLQFIEQLAFLSSKLKMVNPPNYHSIDLSILPPKELLSTMKTTRKELMFQPNKYQNKTLQNAGFGLHSLEIEFFEQLLGLLTVLGCAIAPYYDPAIEDLKVFAYRRKFVGKKKHISFRARALMARSSLKTRKSSPEIEGTRGEEKSIGTTNPKRRSSATVVRKSVNRSTTSTISSRSATAQYKKNEPVIPWSVIDPGACSNGEIIHYLKMSILNSKAISHLACWITCGDYNIQMKVLKVLRYLMHVGQAQQTDTQAPCKEPVEAWVTNRLNTNPAVQHLSVRHVIQYCGPYLLDLLSPSSKGGLGRMSLMVIHECIINGELESRIALVKLGSFAQIIKYIRASEDKADIQALCLVVLRKLVSSEQSLKQLFFAYGGMSLVMALHEYKHGVVKEQAAFTLAALSKGSTIAKSKVVSKKRHKKSLSTDDIWDHVTYKWEGQDKVSKLLKKFNVRY